MTPKHHSHHVAQRAHSDAPYVKAFIAKVLPIAGRVKSKWGVPIGMLIAQGALESGWGLHVKGNAYFGIKGKSQSGGSIKFGTHEVVGGERTSVTDNFRAYASLEEAADDYGQFLKNNPRYAASFAYSNQPEMFAQQIATAHYATDAGYGKKLISIIRAHHLAAYDHPETKP